MGVEMSNTFKVEVAKDGKSQEVELRVNLPDNESVTEGEKAYNKRFSEALSSGAFLRIKMDDIAKEQGLWSDDKQQELTEMQNEIATNEKILAKGGCSVLAAKKSAIKIRQLRNKIQLLVLQRLSLDPKTAEAQAEASQFDVYIYRCLVYNSTGERYFETFDDYLQQNMQHSDIIVQAFGKLTDLLHGETSNDEELPENKFLLDYGFVNKDLNLINKDGDLVDIEGRLINEAGYYINSDGALVDIKGNLLDDEGNLKCEFSPFTDEDGKDVLLEDVVLEDVVLAETKPEVKKTRKKRTPKEQQTKTG